MTGAADDAARLRPSPTRRWAAILLGALAAVLLLEHAGTSAARRLGLVATQAPFTALSFADPGALPSAVAPGGSLSLAVQIANHEGKRRTYRWLVDLVPAGRRPELLAAGTATVADLGTRQLAITVKPPTVAGTAVLDVRLVSPPETISLHLAEG